MTNTSVVVRCFGADFLLTRQFRETGTACLPPPNNLLERNKTCILGMKHRQKKPAMATIHYFYISSSPWQFGSAKQSIQSTQFAKSQNTPHITLAGWVTCYIITHGRQIHRQLASETCHIKLMDHTTHKPTSRASGGRVKPMLNAE